MRRSMRKGIWMDMVHIQSLYHPLSPLEMLGGRQLVAPDAKLCLVAVIFDPHREHVTLGASAHTNTHLDPRSEETICSGRNLRRRQRGGNNQTRGSYRCTRALTMSGSPKASPMEARSCHFTSIVKGMQCQKKRRRVESNTRFMRG